MLRNGLIDEGGSNAQSTCAIVALPAGRGNVAALYPGGRVTTRTVTFVASCQVSLVACYIITGSLVIVKGSIEIFLCADKRNGKVCHIVTT